MSVKVMPVLFIGHGSPMNCIADNGYTRDLRSLAKRLPVPEAIAVISAHWLTRGIYVSAARFPEQIYDFSGFPDELYRVIYRAPGSPRTASLVADTVPPGVVVPDLRRGIDHAAWAVLAHLFPLQDVPVIEISIDPRRDARYHYELGRGLRALRERGVLVIGSGNIVHNLYEIDFDEAAEPFPWAVEFDSFARGALASQDVGALIDYGRHPLSERAVPTNDHYLPMIAALGLGDEEDDMVTIHESIQNASISMRSFMLAHRAPR